MVKHLSCNAGDMGSIPGRDLRSYVPWSNKDHEPQLESLCAEMKCLLDTMKISHAVTEI